MRLTRHADYALRVLMYLGLNEGGVCTIGEIAAAYRISESHLMKVVHRLGVLELVQTVRGHGGGLHLALAPEDISLGRVVRLVEDLRIVECFDPKTNTCPVAGPCSLTGVLGDARDAFLDVLDRRTLADLLGPRRALLRRLRANAPSLAAARKVSPGVARTLPRSGRPRRRAIPLVD
jgi:Rrf2 family nitric oxide-sensitive transcriptional repressor